MTDRAALDQSLVMERLPHPPPPPPVAAPVRPEFEQVYAEQFAFVWHTLRRLGVPAAEREDLAHDLFVVVHRRLVDYDPARPLRPWLFGIAYRLAAEHRRRRPPRGDEVEPAELADSGPSPERITAGNEARRQAARALGQLPLDQRAVFVLHDIDGVAVPEIAGALELPLNTVYSRLRLARAKFAQAIGAQEGGDR